MKVTQMSAFNSAPLLDKTPGQTVYKSPALKSSHDLGNISRALSGFEKDDYILLGIIAVLFFEGCDDYILLAALGYLFFMGLKDR